MKLFPDLNKSIRDEKGQALILVLILMLVGGLIIAPLLGFMSTGLMAGQVFEKKTDELYAANAGVEDALWHLIYGGLVVAEGTPVTLTPFTMNDKTVNVTIENIIGEPVHKITSIAVGTAIESYVRIAITYVGDELPEGETIDGDVITDGAFWMNEDATIDGSIYAEGDVGLGKDARITGNVIAVGDIHKGGYFRGECRIMGMDGSPWRWRGYNRRQCLRQDGCRARWLC